MTGTDESFPATAAAAGEDVVWERSLGNSYRDEYLTSKLWGKIKRRVLKRDGKLCYRCGGKATAVHHRSYTAEVLAGNDDSRLVSICDGCHTVIHFDGTGKKRSMEETDRQLLERSEGTDFPRPKIDLRKKRPEYPAQWKRMSAVQQVAWERESQRLLYLRWLQRTVDSKSAQIYRKWLYNYGMNDSSIDSAIATGSRKRTKRKE